MLQVNPNHRPSAQEIIDKLIPKKDFTKTMIKSDSQPDFLNTIRIPRDLIQLKKVLPGKRYKDKEKKENKLPVLSSAESQIDLGKKKEPEYKRPQSHLVLQENKSNVNVRQQVNVNPVSIYNQRAKSPDGN